MRLGIIRHLFPSFPRIRVVMFVYVVAGIVATALYGVASATAPPPKPGTVAAPVEQKSVLEKTVTFATSVLGGGFALYSFLLSVEQKRVEYAAKLIERWNNPSAEFTAYKDALYKAYTETLKPGDFIDVGDEEKRRTRNQIKGLCDFCEEVSLAVRLRTADEKTIKAFLELVVRLTWDCMNPWIKGQRDKLKGYDPLKPTIYVEVENLATRWKAEEETEAALLKLEQSTRS